VEKRKWAKLKDDAKIDLCTENPNAEEDGKKNKGVINCCLKMSVTSSVNSTSRASRQPATHSVVVRTNAAEKTETQAGVFVQARMNELLLVNNEGIAVDWVGQNADR